MGHATQSVTEVYSRPALLTVRAGVAAGIAKMREGADG
jgi:hypothetical protein